MDYRDTVFLSVAEQLSFSKAADHLFISQPAVTKHIKELESKLKITLFERKGNKIYLSKAGKLAYDHLKRIKEQYAELEFEMGRLNKQFKGSLRIGASSTISQYIIPGVMAAFHKKYPQIELFLFNGNSFEVENRLLSHDIDLALVENDSSQSDIRYLDFLDDEIVAVTGSNSVYAKRKFISIADLHEIPMILREKGSGTLEVIRKSLQKQSVNLDELNILIHLGSTEAIKNFLCNFNGLALVSEKSIAKEILLKEIVRIGIKNLVIDRKFRLAFRHGPEGMLQKLFTDFLFGYNHRL